MYVDKFEDKWTLVRRLPAQSKGFLTYNDDGKGTSCSMLALFLFLQAQSCDTLNLRVRCTMKHHFESIDDDPLSNLTWTYTYSYLIEEWGSDQTQMMFATGDCTKFRAFNLYLFFYSEKWYI